MIVQCPSCTSRYRIRDANIPASGGKIRCPSCSHSFIVYPESQEAEDEKTSITGGGELARLAGQMGSRGDAEEDDGQTEVVKGAELDKMRALQALRSEMGNALENDGTVEIQNPLEMWKAAQAGAAQAKAEAAQADDSGSMAEYGDPSVDEDEYDVAQTEVVSPDALNFAIPKPGGSDEEVEPEPEDATTMLGGDERPAWEDPDKTVDAFGPDSPAPPAQPPKPQPSGPPARPSLPQPGARNDQAPPSPSSPTGPPVSPEPAPIEQVRATREDSGPSAPNTDPFSLPESGPNAASDPAADPFARDEERVPSEGNPARVPVGAQANDAFDGADTSEPAGGPDPRHEGPWKLKTNFGLTYEFPDNKSLRSWMSSREELDGHTLSADGQNFYGIRDFPQLHRSPSSVSQQIPSYDQKGQPQQGRPGSGAYGQHQQAQPPAEFDEAPTMEANALGNQPSSPGPSPAASNPAHAPPAGGFNGGQSMGGRPSPAANTGFGSSDAPGFGGPQQQNPAPPRPSVRKEYVPPSSTSIWDKVVWLVLIMLILAAGIIAVHTFGIYDVVGEARKVLGIAEPQQQGAPAVPSVQKEEPVLPEAAIDGDSEKEAEFAEQLLRDARRETEKNRLPAALKKLESVEQIDDGIIEIYELRAKIYDQMGQAEKAESARARVAELRPAADPDAGTADAE